MSKIQWSIVCPIKDEVDLITKTFPSFYAVNPSEVIFCFDNPPHKEAYEIAKKIADKHKNIPTKFLFVDRNPEFGFHQAWVRRKGFLEAKHDLILTVDIDIILDPKVREYLSYIKGNVKLVSFSKFSYPISLRKVVAWLIQKFYYHKSFTGLYAFSRSAWLETEDAESLKKIVRGEDTHLHEALTRKYDDKFIAGIKNIVLRPAESRKYQYLMGWNRWKIRRASLWRVLISTFLYLRPYLLVGYLKARLGEF